MAAPLFVRRHEKLSFRSSAPVSATRRISTMRGAAVQAGRPMPQVRRCLIPEDWARIEHNASGQEGRLYDITPSLMEPGTVRGDGAPTTGNRRSDRNG